MSVWLCLPSKRPFEQVDPVFALWRERGYKIALWRDEEDWKPFADYDLCVGSACEYPGYAAAVNWLAKLVLEMHPDCEWIVCAGDDTEPDASKSAEEIAAQCSEHFLGDYYEHNQSSPVASKLRTFGVMQPTGDRWGDHQNTHIFTAHHDGSGRCNQCGHEKNHYRHQHGAYIDRVAGSPWMGREFCLRVNQGRGPLWPGYFHMGCDEELQAVATRLGVFWQRPDLIHLHKHWGRSEGGKLVDAATMPEFLKRANSLEEWNAYKTLFAQREAAGFPGSEPLA